MSERHVRKHLPIPEGGPAVRCRLPDPLRYHLTGHWTPFGPIRGLHRTVPGTRVTAHMAGSSVLQGRLLRGEDLLVAAGRLQFDAGSVGLPLRGLFDLRRSAIQTLLQCVSQ